MTRGLDAMRGGGLEAMNRPVVSETRSNANPMMKPLVSTQCRSYDIAEKDKESPRSERRYATRMVQKTQLESP